eukprot:4300594-Pyramimonas_sp.AAC.1
MSEIMMLSERDSEWPTEEEAVAGVDTGWPSCIFTEPKTTPPMRSPDFAMVWYSRLWGTPLRLTKGEAMALPFSAGVVGKMLGEKVVGHVAEAPPIRRATKAKRDIEVGIVGTEPRIGVLQSVT